MFPLSNEFFYFFLFLQVVLFIFEYIYISSESVMSEEKNKK